MDLAFTKEDLAFRDEVRAFIAANFDEDMRQQSANSKNGYMSKEAHVRWQKALYAKGWAATNWPKQYGGAGFTPAQKYLFELEMTAAGAPGVMAFGMKMVAPVIMKFGSEEQKAQHLPKILSSDIWWCQGYSEPGSGSDLASLQMKCEDKGDHYLLNGSKIWTTLAQYADWMFNLVRTDNSGKTQEGISFILVDMKTPGITVRALPTLDGPPEGRQEINQVFYEDVKVPKENLIGKPGEGWTYAKYLLQFERGNAYAPGLKRSLQKVRKIAAQEAQDGKRVIDDPEFARKAADLDVQISAMEFVELRIFSALSSGQAVGPESSMLKCRGTELQQEIAALTLEAVGNYITPFVEDTQTRGSNEPRPGPAYAATTAPYYFSVRKASIYAGSNEIQRNIMAKAVLGL
ncbi:Putative acyl-CoA dehydrogenase FadE17 [Alphaproteobacteria bacterium SO-S41]|nr:Putative acyl-CoA dehydrogenase FadE17 [Alphaproteobacteria bacterium SO-S41]